MGRAWPGQRAQCQDQSQLAVVPWLVSLNCPGFLPLWTPPGVSGMLQTRGRGVLMLGDISRPGIRGGACVLGTVVGDCRKPCRRLWWAVRGSRVCPGCRVVVLASGRSRLREACWTKARDEWRILWIAAGGWSVTVVCSCAHR